MRLRGWRLGRTAGYRCSSVLTSLQLRWHAYARSASRRGRDPDDIEVTIFEYDPGGSRSSSQDLVDRYAAAGADRMVIIEGMGDHRVPPSGVPGRLTPSKPSLIKWLGAFSSVGMPTRSPQLGQ